MRKTGKWGAALLGKILVKTNVNKPISTKGFRMDQKTPKDMLRYRILKSLTMRLANRGTRSPCHCEPRPLPRAGYAEETLFETYVARLHFPFRASGD